MCGCHVSLGHRHRKREVVPESQSLAWMGDRRGRGNLYAWALSVLAPLPPAEEEQRRRRRGHPHFDIPRRLSSGCAVSSSAPPLRVLSCLKVCDATGRGNPMVGSCSLHAGSLSAACNNCRLENNSDPKGLTRSWFCLRPLPRRPFLPVYDVGGVSAIFRHAVVRNPYCGACTRRNVAGAGVFDWH